MFNRESWNEILESISKNKLRTFLTAFSIFWGILMLILLLGSGKGLENGLYAAFSDDANNSLFIYGGTTSLPHAGMQPGRNIEFTNQDYDQVTSSFEEIEYKTARYSLWRNNSVSYRNNYGSYSIRAVHPDHQYLERSIILEGRFINELDLEEGRKVVVVSDKIREELFKDSKNYLGQFININGILFKVVGTYLDNGSERENNIIYLPISVAQRAFGGGNKVSQIMFTVGEADLERTLEMEEEIRMKLSSKHNFSPDDPRALRINNNLASFERYFNTVKGIRLFIWIIGVCTLIAGIIGVSNILLITVKERTKEFGVRKALGATPMSIISLIMQESVLITGVAGYIGLVVGIFLLEYAQSQIPDEGFFRSPEVSLSVAISATVLLVIAGALAGLIPAFKAARIKPIEALRDE